MQTIIRFGTKKGFQAFPSLASFGSIGNELGTDQGLYLPASIIKSHLRLVQERGAQGIERCLIYSKRSSLQHYHVLALIIPIDPGKPEWRDGALAGVAMLAHGQMIREKEALAVLESELNELLAEHPISSGQAEGAELLNWKTSNRLVPISLFSPWKEDFIGESAELIPAFKANESWHQRVSLSFDLIASLGRAIILPLHDAVPNISGWSAPSFPAPIAHQESSESDRSKATPSSSVSVPNDDIKRLSSALEQEQELNEELSKENKRLRTSNNQKSKEKSSRLLIIGVVGLCLGVGIGWISTKQVDAQPRKENNSNSTPGNVLGPYQYYWESLAFRSKNTVQAAQYPVDAEPAYLEYAYSTPMPIARAALNLEEVIGSKFFEWRLNDLMSILSQHHVDRKLPNQLLCTPCIKYGIIEYQIGEDHQFNQTTTLLNFHQMIDSIAPQLDSLGNKFLITLLNNVEAGFLGEGRYVAVRKGAIWNNENANTWQEAASDVWEDDGNFNYLTNYSKSTMILELTDYVEAGVNDNAKQPGDSITFWVPEKL